MGLTEPRQVFGIHSMTPFNLTTGLFDYGIFKIIGEMNLDLSADFVNNTGGSNNYPWAVERGLVNGEISGTIRSYQDNALSLFLGATVTENAAETTGNVSALTNVNGTSVFNATTGLASIALTTDDEADLKFGKYIFEATDTDKLKLYVSSDVDFLRGTDEEYEDDTLLVDSEFTIVGSDATQVLAGFGLTFTEGSGAASMTIGDTASFEVRPVNTGSSIIDIGKAGESVTEFGLIMNAEKRSDGSLFEIVAERCFAYGYPIGMSAKEWSEASIKISMLYSSTKNRVLRMRAIK